MRRKLVKFWTDKFDTWVVKQTEVLTHKSCNRLGNCVCVNGWFQPLHEPDVYMIYMSQYFRLFHVSNLSVLNFRNLSAHISGVCDTSQTQLVRDAPASPAKYDMAWISQTDCKSNPVQKDLNWTGPDWKSTNSLFSIGRQVIIVTGGSRGPFFRGANRALYACGHGPKCPPPPWIRQWLLW